VTQRVVARCTVRLPAVGRPAAKPRYLEAMSTGAPLRQPIPVGRSILWSPVSGGAQRPDDLPFPIFFSQAALTAIHEHIATPHRAGQGILGFLLGDLCECPDTNVSYLVIDLALRLNQPIYGDRTRDVVTRLWDPIQGQLEEQRAQLLGWYHTHPPHPLVLSAHDVETHEHYFAERWHVALLLAPDAAEPGGSFFRASDDDAWTSTPLPFYELLSEDSIRPDGTKRSFMTWKDYHAFDPTTSAAAGRAAPGPAPTRVAPPPPSGPRFTPTPRPAPAAAPRPPADTGELKFLTAAEDMPPPLPPPPPRQARPSRPAPEPRAAPAPEPAAPLWPEEFADPQPPLEAVEEAPAPPRPPRVRRRRRPIPPRVRRALWVIVIGAVAAGAYWWFEPTLPLPKVSPATIANTWSALTDKWSATWSGLTAKVSAVVSRLRRSAAVPPPRAPNAPGPRPGPAPHPPAPRSVAPTAVPPSDVVPRPVAPTAVQPSDAVVRLDRIGDSLTHAVRTFADRRALFARSQLACTDLARSLEAVENHWTAYTAARRGSGTLDATRAARDQTLYARVDSVERRYEQSGCPRP
jgi:hypothetical protein